ncbi:BEM_collapsed_G0048410.mRNA.1.CDS.1 [Saccharomyces cerevisiae]|nr:BEM_collapsed_G0048410.mRNA.1.CDS.1 [Saccharomyces cerevisiae]
MKKNFNCQKYVDCLYLAPSTPSEKQIKCYCGNHTRANIKCGETKFPKSGKSSEDENGNRWIGVLPVQIIELSTTHVASIHS